MKWLRAALTLGIGLAGCDANRTQQSQVPVVSSAPKVPSHQRDAYDLQEKCGRDVREWFKAFYGDGTSKVEGMLIPSVKAS
jgi:hypothetical protein